MSNPHPPIPSTSELPPAGQRRATADRSAGRGRRLIQLGRVGCAVLAVAAVIVFVVGPSAAFADPGVLLAAPPTPVSDLGQVVDNIRTWLFTILVGVATLFATLGAVRLLAANGDPVEVEKGKSALKSAALGYGLAILAPLLVTIVGGWLVAK